MIGGNGRAGSHVKYSNHLEIINQLQTSPDPIWAEMNPAHTERDIPAGFSEDDGWMIVRYFANNIIGTNQFPIAAHSGSSANTAGVRINTNNKHYAYFRENNNDQSNDIKHEILAEQIKVVGISWNAAGYQYALSDGQFNDATGRIRSDLGSITKLRIGARNGGLEPLDGKVVYAEIGNQYISPKQIRAKMSALSKPFVIVSAGQSNAQNFWDGAETTANKGMQGVQNGIGAVAGKMGEVLYINGAEGGSALFKAVDAEEYWMEDNGSDGVEMIDFFNYIEGYNFIPNAIHWDQGEAESHKIDGAGGLAAGQPSRADYKARLIQVLSRIHDRYPLAPIFIIKLGRRDAFTNTNPGIQIIAEIQQELIDDPLYPWILFGAERHDLALFDGVHYTDAAYEVLGGRLGRSIARAIGYEVSGGTKGSIMTSGNRTAAVIDVSIEHDGGNDYTPTTGIEGFAFIRDSDSAVFTGTGVRIDGATVQVTLSGDPAGAGFLYYMYDAELTINLANILKDNGAHTLPMRRCSIAVT